MRTYNRRILMALSACAAASIRQTQAPMTERYLRSRLQRKERPMSKELQPSKASRHRRDAAACGAFATNAKSATDRELLLRMQRSLLERASHQEWLDGLPPVPPAGCNSLAVPTRS